jgi:Domain of unknown function (DUF4184)
MGAAPALHARLLACGAMPYPFAHPVAVLPLAPALGRFAVPSALVIGSMVPDAWYLIPGLARADSHSASGLVFFCLPLGLVAYLVFQRLAREPLIALLPHGIAARIPTPSRPLAAGIVVSLLAGALTHIAWDVVAHSVAYRGVNVLQHASTAFGTLILAWWCARWLRRAPIVAARRKAAPTAWRAALVVALGAAGWWTFVQAQGADAQSLRLSLRDAAADSARVLGAALLLYCAAWKLREKHLDHLCR